MNLRSDDFQYGFRGVGSYDIGGIFDTGIQSLTKYNAGLHVESWSTAGFPLDHMGTLRVISYNKNTKTITGTFNFTAISTSSVVTSVKVENGAFNLTY